MGRVDGRVCGAAPILVRKSDRENLAEAQCLGRMVVPLIPATAVVGPPSPDIPAVLRCIRPVPLIVPRFTAVEPTFGLSFFVCSKCIPALAKPPVGTSDVKAAAERGALIVSRCLPSPRSTLPCCTTGMLTAL